MKEELQVLDSMGPFGTVIDVGANVGEFSEHYAQQGCQRVLALEPNPDILPDLQRRLLKYSNAEIVPVGLSNQTRKALLYNDSPSTLATVEDSWVKDFFQKDFLSHKNVEVSLYSWEDFCRLHKVHRVDLLKIDTEGHDWAVLESVLSSPILPRVLMFELTHGRKVWDRVLSQLDQKFKIVQEFSLDGSKGMVNQIRIQG